MWYKYAKPGDKVVCKLNASHDEVSSYAILSQIPTKGKVYTIEEISAHQGYVSGIKIELVGFPDNGFCASLFRPLEKISTDKSMSILKAILNGKRVTEDA